MKGKDKRMSRIKTFGIELEGGVYYKGTPDRVNLFRELGLTDAAPCIIIPGVATVGTDNGIHEIEFSLTPCESLSELEGKLGECISWLKPDWEVYWIGQDPFVRDGSLPPAPWAPKPRYAAIREVVARESGYPDTGSCMDWMSQYWAYQVHIGVDPYSEEGNTLRNYLDNSGPHIAHSFPMYTPNLLQSDRVKKAWVGWGDERRLPGCRWFETPREMHDAWSHVPRVARKNEHGIWVPDTREDVPQPGDPIHEGFVWWGTRPRYTLGTIEFRWPDSLPPDSAVKLTARILEFSEEVLKGWKPTRSSEIVWEWMRSDYWGLIDSFPKQ